MAYPDYISYGWALARGEGGATITVITAYTTTLSATAGYILAPNNSFKYSSMPSSDEYLRVTSESANDATAGSGAVTICIVGLDSNNDPVTETLAISGQTPKTTASQYVRINRMYVNTCGSGGINAGNIYISRNNDSTAAGLPKSTSTVLCSIAAGDGQSHHALYTVPASYTAYLPSLGYGSGQGSVFQNNIKLYTKRPGNPKMVDYNVSWSDGGYRQYVLDTPLKFSSGTDIWFEATGAASASSTNVDMQFVLIAGD